MKYLISLVAGLLFGMTLFVLGYVLNPFVGQSALSPLAVSEAGIAELSYSAVPSKSIALANDGESFSRPHPGSMSDLWEPTIKDSELMVTSLTDSRGRPAGIGIKLSTPSEKTDLLRSKVLVDSIWHLYLPGRGTALVYQQEDRFAYLRDIVMPAWRSSSDSWRGTWSRNMTIGPNALGTATVHGLSGEFTGVSGEAVEMVNARAYSTLLGPVAMTGTLSVELPPQVQQTSQVGN